MAKIYIANAEAAHADSSHTATSPTGNICRRGVTVGSWCASPATQVGYELIAAGLIPAGGGRGVPLDYGEPERWSRVGYERGMAMRRGER
jgi:hypothetical protein